MGDDMPPDPITSLAEMATQLHEMYAAFIAAGFTEAQAMQMVCTVIRPHPDGS